MPIQKLQVGFTGALPPAKAGPPRRNATDHPKGSALPAVRVPLPQKCNRQQGAASAPSPRRSRKRPFVVYRRAYIITTVKLYIFYIAKIRLFFVPSAKKHHLFCFMMRFPMSNIWYYISPSHIILVSDKWYYKYILKACAIFVVSYIWY